MMKKNKGTSISKAEMQMKKTHLAYILVLVDFMLGYDKVAEKVGTPSDELLLLLEARRNELFNLATGTYELCMTSTYDKFAESLCDVFNVEALSEEVHVIIKISTSG